VNVFEVLIGKTFQSYRDAKLANIFFLHPPMRIAGMHGKVPCFIQAGKAPYDAAGILLQRRSNCDRCGVEGNEGPRKQLWPSSARTRRGPACNTTSLKRWWTCT
jgi:hypothetical protein